MFQLSVQDIHPGQQAGNKEEAIRQVAAALVSAGNVADGYVNGMLAREQQPSTFLGNGIAIPHGTTDTRDQVLKTGVQVFQFPQGVTWGEGQTAYVAIGIAASWCWRCAVRSRGPFPACAVWRNRRGAGPPQRGWSISPAGAGPTV